jgi:hypothetical protein
MEAIMRSIILASVLLLAAVPVAHAIDLEVDNNSSSTIQHLYISGVGESRWGPDQLGERRRDVIRPGGSFTVYNIDAGRYDLKLVAEDGTACVIKNQRVGQDKVWTVTEAMLDDCG